MRNKLPGVHLVLKKCEVQKRQNRKLNQDRQNFEGQMVGAEMEELVVHLERTMDLSTMEQGVKLMRAALVNKTLNKWGVRNILRSAWKDHTYIVTV